MYTLVQQKRSNKIIKHYIFNWLIINFLLYFVFENKYYIYQNQVCQACKLSIFSVNKSRMLGLSIIYFLCCSLSPELHCIKTEKQFTRYIRESKCKPGVYIFSWKFCFFPPPLPHTLFTFAALAKIFHGLQESKVKNTSQLEFN